MTTKPKPSTTQQTATKPPARSSKSKGAADILSLIGDIKPIKKPVDPNSALKLPKIPKEPPTQTSVHPIPTAPVTAKPAEPVKRKFAPLPAQSDSDEDEASNPKAPVKKQKTNTAEIKKVTQNNTTKASEANNTSKKVSISTVSMIKAKLAAKNPIKTEKCEKKEESKTSLSGIFSDLKRKNTKNVQKTTGILDDKSFDETFNEEANNKNVSDDMGWLSGQDTTRKRTEEGFLIYTYDELKFEEGGDTPLCPFDCDCCFA